MNALGSLGTLTMASALVAALCPVAAQAQVHVLESTVVYQPKSLARVNGTAAGHLVIVIRQADHPVRPVQGARVRLLRASAARPDSFVLQRETPLDGIVELDSMAVGKFVVRTHALGFRAEDVAVSILPGCFTFIEIYLLTVPYCLYECPRTPPRATITTCRPDA